MADAGFDSSVLSEFRTRLVKGSAEELLLDILLEKCKERKWVKAKGRQRTDSTHVLGWARVINRLIGPELKLIGPDVWGKQCVPP